MRKGQVQGIIFKVEDGVIKFLLLKRIKEKGGFWQPLTGGIEGEETPKEALRRELVEELGIKKAKNTIDLKYKFSFILESGSKLTEHVFGVELDPIQKSKLSGEHTECKWVDFQKALRLLKWESNKKSLVKLKDYLAQDIKLYF